MLPSGQNAKIGNVIFKDITVYSKLDKIREKRTYVGEISGMKIRVSNQISEGKFSYKCENVQNSYLNFRADLVDTFELAFEYAIKNVKYKLKNIINQL